MEIVIPLVRNAKRVIVFTGAGISTNAQIPDYVGDGTTERVSFSADSDLTDLYARMEKARPTKAHLFCKWLSDSGRLVRIYTQNIDGLHQAAGVPAEKVVEFHGNWKTGVTFFGASISEEALATVKEDLIVNVDQVDLVLVLGTSLQVFPFAALPNMVRKTCARIIVSRDLSYIPRPSRKQPQTGFSNVINVCGQKVTTKPIWIDRRYTREGIYLSKWRNQYMLEMDCDGFATAIMEG